VRADTDTTSFEIQPLTPDRWDDLETLFGPRGADGGCWCMFWRVTRAEFGRQCAHNGAGNKAAFQAVVASGDAPGLLAYAEGKPVGWCSVAPREVYGALERSPKRRRIDDQPVWSITCFYVADGWRRKGVNSALVQGAIEQVKREGGTLLEAYPRLNAPGMTQRTARRRATPHSRACRRAARGFTITGLFSTRSAGRASPRTSN
jgi:GNAT superfamily N-acetyltransferase